MSKRRTAGIRSRSGARSCPTSPCGSVSESTESGPEIEQIVTSRINGNKVGLLVDQVIGQHQTVIKSLGKAYRNIREISGATILGDGTLALILEIGQLTEAEKLIAH